MQRLPALIRLVLALKHAGSASAPFEEGKKASVETYIEQTKLLVTLSSAFLLAPAGLVALLKDRSPAGITADQTVSFVIAEVLFILSVLAGYVVLATIAGWQAKGRFDIYRTATMRASLAQIIFYLAGLVVFIFLGVALARAPVKAEASLPPKVQAAH